MKPWGSQSAHLCVFVDLSNSFSFKTKIESVKSYKDAVVLLDSPPPNNQVICLHDLSPLAKLNQNEKALQTMVDNMVTLLGTLPDKKIPLLRFVALWHWEISAGSSCKHMCN